MTHIGLIASPEIHCALDVNLMASFLERNREDGGNSQQ
jgi:hypothetical protein